MWSWASALLLLIKLVASMVEWAKTREILEAADAKRMAQILRGSVDVLERVEGARADAIRKFRDTGGMPDDNDPNLRD